MDAVMQHGDFRVALLQEELNELTAAIAAGDEVEVLDALTDLQYVLDGAFLSLGFHKMKRLAFDEVHRSNLSKLGLDGRPVFREDGKVLKPDHWSPPRLKGILDYCKEFADDIE